MNSAAPALPLGQLALCLVPVLFVYFQLQRATGVRKGAFLASARMLIQLSLIGYALVALFSVKSPLPILGMLFFMLTVAS